MPEFIPHYIRFVVYGKDPSVVEDIPQVTRDYQTAYSYLLGKEKAYGFALDAARLVGGRVMGVYTEHTDRGLQYHEVELCNFESNVGSSNPQEKGNK